MKTKRLFVSSTVTTDEVSCHCGGPDVDDAVRGLMAMIRSDVEELLNGKEGFRKSEIVLSVEEMTDEEVAAIPEM